LNKKTNAPISAREAPYRRIGQIVGAFGVKGQVKVQPLTDFWERFEEGTSLLLEDQEVAVEQAFEHKGRLVLKLSGIDDIETAETFQFKYLLGSSAFVPNLDKDEYMTADLVGLTVVTSDGMDLGVVKDVIASPAHDIIVVGEVMIPAVKQFVKKVDIKHGKMVVELIEGMLPEEA